MRMLVFMNDMRFGPPRVRRALKHLLLIRVIAVQH